MTTPTLRKTEPSIQEKFQAKKEALALNPLLLHTRHRVIRGDARIMAEVFDESLHLVVTSPPYWILKQYDDASGKDQLGHLEDYDKFQLELRRVWQRCFDS